MDYVKRQGPCGEERLTIGFALEEGELEELVTLGALEKLEQSSRRLLDEKVTMVRLLEGWESLKLTPKQKKAAQFLAEHESVSLRELCYYTGVTRSVAEALQSKGAVDFYDHVVFRNPYGDVQPEPTSAVTLNTMQQGAFETLSAMLEHPQSRHCSTGNRLGEEHRCFPSLPSVGERAKPPWFWCRLSLTTGRWKPSTPVLAIRWRCSTVVFRWENGWTSGAESRRQAQIVVGTVQRCCSGAKSRSLVIDEEQEHTYKSDKSRFHAEILQSFAAAITEHCCCWHRHPFGGKLPRSPNRAI